MSSTWRNRCLGPKGNEPNHDSRIASWVDARLLTCIGVSRLAKREKEWKKLLCQSVESAC